MYGARGEREVGKELCGLQEAIPSISMQGLHPWCKECLLLMHHQNPLHNIEVRVFVSSHYLCWAYICWTTLDVEHNVLSEDDAS